MKEGLSEGIKNALWSASLSRDFYQVTYRTPALGLLLLKSISVSNRARKNPGIGSKISAFPADIQLRDTGMISCLRTFPPVLTWIVTAEDGGEH